MKPVSALALELTGCMSMRDDIPLHFYTDGSFDVGTLQSGPRCAWAFCVAGRARAAPVPCNRGSRGVHHS
eukprot:10856116-Alexandrium_andersonii.AAC.1